MNEDPREAEPTEDEALGRELPQWSLMAGVAAILVFGLAMGLCLPSDLDGHGTSVDRRVGSRRANGSSA